MPHLHRDWAYPLSPSNNLEAAQVDLSCGLVGQACGVAVCVQACRDIELSCTNVGVVFQLLVLAEFAYAPSRVAVSHCCMLCPPYSVFHPFGLADGGWPTGYARMRINSCVWADPTEPIPNRVRIGCASLREADGAKRKTAPLLDRT
jgi:hypothetical protein